MNPFIHENLVEEFWLSAKIHKEGDGGKGAITARVQDIEIVISETVIRGVMAFTDKPTDPISLEKGVIEEIKDVDTVEATVIPNVIVEEEHDIEIINSRPSDEDLYVVKLPEFEDVMTRDESDMDFDFEMETVLYESNPSEQKTMPTTENLEALLKHVKRSVGNPPPAPSFADQEPPLDVAADLAPRKIRLRDPRPRVVVSEPETGPILVTKIETITVEPTEPLPQSKESTAGSSSHTKNIDYDSFLFGKTRIRVDKGKNVLPEDEKIDIMKL
ncbi:hypothetical protein R6Q57_008384 [Mikania cordata]